jgi:ABC-type dipeptide/oligopeptide/nickel transport system permease component
LRHLAALNRDGPVDAGACLFALFGVATPDFLVGICLQLIFGYALGILPVSGQLNPNLQFHQTITGMVVLDSLLVANWPIFGSALVHLILPSIALAVAGLSQVVRLRRATR